MDNMENSVTRTELDTIINAFLSSELNAKEFVTKLNDDLFSNENLLKMHDYLKSNRQESVLMHFYENQLQSIPVKPDNDKLQKMNQLEVLEYLEILHEDAFEARLKELEKFENEILPLHIQNYSNLGENNNIVVSNEQKGFDYKGSFSNIERFHKSLERSGYIQVEYQEFKKYFQPTFIPNENKVFWRDNINHLYYLIQEIRKFDKNVFAFDRSNYRKIIPLMFEYIPETKKEPLSEKTLSQNNKINFDTSLLDKAIAHLSKT